MQFDTRCLQLTIRRNTAYPQVVELIHFEGCMCNPNQVIITHKKAIVINTPQHPGYCPCGLPTHKGLCVDADREAKGLEPIKWRP